VTLDREVEPAESVEPVGSKPASANWPAIVLAYGSVLPAVLAAAWVLAALPLLLIHIYRPAPAIILGLIVFGLLARPAGRVAAARSRAFGAVPWWAVAGVFAVVIGFGVLAFVTSASDVLVRRDPGSYAMSATWLSTHGTIEMPNHAAAFGGTDPNLVLASQGFYPHGGHIIPQFMTGVPVLMAIGGWASGVSGVLHMNAIIGAFGLLAFGGVVARLVGVRWAVPAVLTLAFVQPQLDVMRATYSEPSAQLILLGGLAVVLDAFLVGRLRPMVAPDIRRVGGDNRSDASSQEARNCRQALLVGGLVLGLVSVVRIDAIADLLPLIPFAGWLAFHRQRAWRALAIGVGAGLLVGAFVCLFLTLPYTKHLGRDIALAGGGFVVTLPLTIIGVRLAWRSRTPGHPSAKRIRSAKWPAAAAIGMLVVGAFFAVRPYVMTSRANPRSGGANYIGQVQRYLGMPVDPTRSYYEDSVRWLSWYFGWATIALALVGATWLTYEQVKGRRRQWMPAWFVFVGMSVAVLYTPSITPDHPWADRRFVPVAVPAVTILAFAAVALIVERIDVHDWQPGVVPAFRTVVAVVVAAAVVLPAWWGSRHVFTLQTEKGEVAMVDSVCAQLRPGDAVLAFGAAGISAWPGTMRIMCGVPTGFLDGRNDAAALERIGERVQAQGGRLMILVDGENDRRNVPGNITWPAHPTYSLLTSEVGHTLVTRPDKPSPLPFDIWLGQFHPSGS
jgi:hypothetical protein